MRQTVAAISLHLLVASLLTGGVACSSADLGDAADDSFITGKADDGSQVEEGSIMALGVLRLVNEASVFILDDDVGLDGRAARAIDSYKMGPDGRFFSDDDRTIATLAELDAIPYVGQAAFERLVAYAFANGYAPSEECAVESPPTACPTNSAPVCGCDGVTYTNACMAARDGSVNVAYAGECLE